ncbi:hypothetical protein BH20ACI1_BH20ACI1_32410 [soil metagenome]
MQNLIGKFDALAGIETENKFARFLERIAFAFLILTFISAPHSIAATQIAWITGMFAWFVRLFIKPRPKLVRTPLDIPLWALFGWSVVSAIFSYAPDISIDKLRIVALFLIFYFAINNLRTKRAAIFLAFALIFSCMVNVVWTPIQRAIGRGVEIHEISEVSPLKIIGLTNGDALIKADGAKIGSPEDIIAKFADKETVEIEFYRPDFYQTIELKKADLLSGNTTAEKLGFADWSKSHNWRSSGFYGHYATYAEVLQLIASLVFGIFIALLSFSTRRRGNAEEDFEKVFFMRHLKIILFICLCGMNLALLLTVTRASQLAFMISAFAIVLLGGNRKIILILTAIALPLIIGGLIFLQTSRNVGFFDSKDNSTMWREIVWREGFDLWTQNPRHFIVGVGMDSQKRFAKQWHLFDDGRLPSGHFHSTPIQLVVERGFPALLLWLWILFVYGRTLWRGIRDSKDENSALSTQHSTLAKGVLLGCFGGMIGFFTSGLVHYNLGDSEVAMVFFLLMGLAVRIPQRDK